MGRKEPYEYNRDDLEEVEEFAVGSYGDVRLLYDKKIDKYVVGKIFQSSGEIKKVKQDFANAKREAKILAQFEHKNIIGVLGATMWDKRSFAIILEHVPNGNLEALLLQDKDISLSWKLRGRFFTELSNALDYLHNHDPNRSYIHGDLKPQNVLLGDLLVIKLADFGAAAINKYTGASTMSISGESNTQHTPYYTAPEFLKNPTKRRSQSMDVYSFGLIGYEILTRRAVYIGAGASSEVVLHLIKFEGQKPDETLMNEVETLLKENSNDSEIFRELIEIVKQSWETDPEDRPKIADIKKKLEILVQSKKIYDKATDKEAEAVVKSRKSPSTPSLQKHQPSKITAMKQWKKRVVISAILSMLVLFAALIIRNLDSNADVSHNGFLGIDDYGKLVKYNVFTNSFSVSSFASCSRFESLVFFFDSHAIVKASELVYVFGWNRFTRGYFALKLNLSDSSLACWEEVYWEKKYQRRKYIVFYGNILGIGAEDYFYNDDSGTDYSGGIDAVHLINTTTGDWTSLSRMNEPRSQHSLVSFQGLICAIGGMKLNTSECYDPNTNKWAYLPRMKIDRRRSAAVELNSELYVTGGEMEFDEVEGAGRSVEKYNPDLETWVEVAPMKKGRSGHAAGVFNGKIYVIGGGSDLVEAYDPSNNVWEIVDRVKENMYIKFTAF